MEYVIFFLAWYFSGFISLSLMLYFIDKTYTYRDLYNSLIFGLLGGITLIICVILFIGELVDFIKEKINFNMDERIF